MNLSIMGTYVLALWLGKARTIAVGRLGTFQFPAGWYLYVGSALGPGGLLARLARHKRRLALDKRAHWHLDYLRECAVWGGAWVRVSGQRLECAWAAKLREIPRAELVAPGFGPSDCQCVAHLVRVPVLPSDEWFAAVLGAERIIVGNDELDKLLRTLIAGNDESREAAALALRRYGKIAIEPLSAMLGSQDADARWWATRALAEVGGEESVVLLIDALSDRESDVRACAALALGRLEDGAAAPSLAARLADESAFVASIAADALSMIGEPAVSALAEMLGDGDTHVRLLAVRALGRIKSQSAIGPLFGVLEDSSYLVCYYAQEALEALGVGMVFLAP
jgi:Uri superfamily endonuclease